MVITSGTRPDAPVRRAAGRRPVSVGCLFDWYGTACYNRALLLLGVQSAAEDVVCETFAAVLAGSDRPTRADLFAELRARVTARLSTEHRRPPSGEESVPTGLARLDGVARDAIVDAFFGADTIEGIAERIGASPGEIAAAITAGLRALAPPIPRP